MHLVSRKVLWSSFKSHGRFYCNKSAKTEWSRAYAKVIGSGEGNGSASFMIGASNSMHLFNCGEGTDRLLRCSLSRDWSKFPNIFLTQSNWSRMGGLSSVLRQLSLCRKGQSNIYGPNDYHTSVNRITTIMEMPRVIRIKHDNHYNDKGFRVECVQITSDEGRPNVLAYICKIAAHSGKFNIEKCVNIGLTTSMIKEIMNDQIVTLSDGTIIKPNDIKRGSRPATNLLILDIPSDDYLKSFQSNPKFTEYLNEGNSTELIVHFSPQSMVNNDIYRQSVERFQPCRNWLLNDQNRHSGLHSIYKHQINLHQINPDLFPILNCSIDTQPKTLYRYEGDEKHKGEYLNVTTNAKYMFQSENSDMKTKTRQCEDIDNINVTPLERNRCRDQECPKIVFLGTGGQKAMSFRNTSSILIHTSVDSCILLDCGEDTIGQIHRLYGPKTESIISKIKAIFVSHYHDDHHRGLYGVLEAIRKQSLDRKTLLLVPSKNLETWMWYPDNELPQIKNETEIVENKTLVDTELSQDFANSVDVESVKTCEVNHIPFSYAISFVSKLHKPEPFKITFSGDTTPCDSLVHLGRDSTILIHEATFENSLSMKARKQAHSTIAEAIEQGQKMNAKYTILTHFSVRYLLFPPIYEQIDENIGMAFDFMEIVESDLVKLHEIYPELKKKFTLYYDKLEKKTEHYERG